MPYADPLLAREAAAGPYGAAFASRVQPLLDAMAAQGHPAHLISGYRSLEDQARLVAHPQGNPVAAPGSSFHNYGAAADIVPNGDYASGNALLQRLAANPAMGLHSLGSYDPNHIQLAGVTIQDLRSGTPLSALASLAQPAQAQPAAPAPPQAGGPLAALAALAPQALHIHLPGSAPPAPNAPAPQSQPAAPAPVDWGGLLASITSQKPTGPSSADLASNLTRGLTGAPQGAPSDLLAGTTPNLLLTG